LNFPLQQDLFNSIEDFFKKEVNRFIQVNMQQLVLTTSVAFFSKLFAGIQKYLDDHFDPMMQQIKEVGCLD
jgi:hypothetical protein